jgi:alpha-1,3-fucosyltransferase
MYRLLKLKLAKSAVYGVLTVWLIFRILKYLQKSETLAFHLIEHHELPYCNPIIPDAKQSTFQIDNEYYPKYVPVFLNNSYNFSCLNRNNKTKLILFWNKLFDKQDFNFGIGKQDVFRRQNCPVTNCETTDNKARLNESSMILFDIWKIDVEMLPKWRHESQRWIFHLYESQQRNIRHFAKLNGLFNMSATHRFNSNFTPFYANLLHVVWEKTAKYSYNFKPTKAYLRDKSHFAFQIASNCQTPGKREFYISEMQKYARVDIYGKCGEPCPNNGDTWGQYDCKMVLAKKYKFYLSFENSICQDYITEKFFNTLKYNIVPVVYGHGPYERHVPKSAYINAFDFESPKHLVDHMLKVASNSTLYNSYFKWKQYIRYVHYPSTASICEMCIMLNLEQYYGIKRSVIGDLNSFWNESSECKKLDTLTFKLVS